MHKVLVETHDLFGSRVCEGVSVFSRVVSCCQPIQIILLAMQYACRLTGMVCPPSSAGITWLLKYVNGVKADNALWQTAAVTGSVGLLEALKQSCSTANQATTALMSLHNRLSCAPAHIGQTATLHWFRTELPNFCPWDESTPIAAASFGHLDTLQWLQAQGASCRCRFSTKAVRDAVKLGNMQLLKFIVSTARQQVLVDKQQLMVLAIEEGQQEAADLI